MPPLRLGFQEDRRFHHGERGRIGGGFRAACLSKNSFHFGKTLDQLVLELQHPLGFSDGDSRKSCGHVKDRAFVQRRHELTAELKIDRNCGRNENQSNRDGRLGVAKDPARRRLINLEQNAADRDASLLYSIFRQETGS